MIRWLTLVAGVGVAAAALYALLSTTPVERRARRGAPPAVAAPAPGAAAPLGEIDDASRARLERVLREAEREGVAP